MWRAALALVPVVLVAVMAPALGAQGPAITASDYRFTPGELTIAPGERLTLANAGGFHNFEFADGSYPPEPTSAGDPAWDGLSRTFGSAGDHTFVCGAHPEMTGVVRVRDPASATPTPTPTPTPSEPASPEVRRLELAAATFCMRGCRRPGVRVRIDLSLAAAVSGTLRRGGRPFGRVRFGTVAAGPRTLGFRRNAAGRRLVRGRYALRLRVAGDPQPVLRFRVR